jgi:hypothetical protein
MQTLETMIPTGKRLNVQLQEHGFSRVACFGGVVARMKFTRGIRQSMAPGRQVEYSFTRSVFQRVVKRISAKACVARI